MPSVLVSVIADLSAGCAGNNGVKTESYAWSAFIIVSIYNKSIFIYLFRLVYTLCLEIKAPPSSEVLLLRGASETEKTERPGQEKALKAAP